MKPDSDNRRFIKCSGKRVAENFARFGQEHCRDRHVSEFEAGKFGQVRSGDANAREAPGDAFQNKGVAKRAFEAARVDFDAEFGAVSHAVLAVHGLGQRQGVVRGQYRR